ncbi:MAG: omptin family outer membrane protease [Treponema sp.]|nr:omptin family outer membrane protease [Treponema sp.]
MNKNKLIAVFVFLLTTFTYANEDKIFSIKLEPIFGLRNGTLIESVFEKSNNEYKKLSHLNWQHLNNVYLGGNVTLSFWDFNLSVSAAGFIPKRSGTMDDSDWINLDSVKNIYSISENYLWRSAFTGVNLKYDFDILNWLSISPAFAFDYNYTYFNAKNGYGWYATSNYTGTGQNESWDSPYAKFFPKGKLYGITYNRMSLETWLGFSVAFLPIKQLQIELSAFINPVVYMESFDHHEKKGYYADIAYNYFESFKAKIDITGNITKSISVSLNSTLKFIPETLGEAYYSHDNSDYSYIPLTSTKSGSGEFIVDISLSGAYKF